MAWNNVFRRYEVFEYLNDAYGLWLVKAEEGRRGWREDGCRRKEGGLSETGKMAGRNEERWQLSCRKGVM